MNCPAPWVPVPWRRKLYSHVLYVLGRLKARELLWEGNVALWCEVLFQEGWSRQASPGLASTSMEGSFTGKAHSLLANNGKLGKFWVLLQQLKISGKRENVERKKKKVIWKNKNPWKLNKPKDILRIPLCATRKFQNWMFGVLGQRTGLSYITVRLGNKGKRLVF